MYTSLLKENREKKKQKEFEHALFTSVYASPNYVPAES